MNPCPRSGPRKHLHAYPMVSFREPNVASAHCQLPSAREIDFTVRRGRSAVRPVRKMPTLVPFVRWSAAKSCSRTRRGSYQGVRFETTRLSPVWRCRSLVLRYDPGPQKAISSLMVRHPRSLRGLPRPHTGRTNRTLWQIRRKFPANGRHTPRNGKGY